MLELRVRPGTARRLGAGVTLIELMVTVSLIALLATFAAPSYRSFVVNQQLSTASADFLTALLQARSEAVRLGKQVMVVPVQEVQGPSASSYSWLDGWCIFVDANASGAYDSATSTLINCTKKQGLSGVVAVTTGSGKTSGPFAESKPFFAYSPAGFAVAPASRYSSGSINGKLWLTAAETARDRAVIVSKSGRPRICDPKTDPGSTPCNTD